MDVVIGIDVGTGSARAGIFDLSGVKLLPQLSKHRHGARDLTSSNNHPKISGRLFVSLSVRPWIKSRTQRYSVRYRVRCNMFTGRA